MWLYRRPRGRVRVHLLDETTLDGVPVRWRGRHLVLTDAHLVRVEGRHGMGDTWVPWAQVRCVEGVAG